MKISPEVDISVLAIGEEQQPLIVINDLLENPDWLVDYAAGGEGFNRHKSDYYPGIRKPLPAVYSELVCEFLQKHALPEGGVQARQVSSSLSALSVTSDSPSKLLPIQRIPHFDTCDEQQWAVVHYLCDESCGGTGFFRHRQTGYERITTERNKKYQRVLEDEAITKGLPPAEYLQGSSELFEMIHTETARFNRALCYPSNLLHSGLIKSWSAEVFSDVRLTANTFIHIKSA